MPPKPCGVCFDEYCRDEIFFSYIFLLEKVYF